MAIHYPYTFVPQTEQKFTVKYGYFLVITNKQYKIRCLQLPSNIVKNIFLVTKKHQTKHISWAFMLKMPTIA